jgi:GTPase involved in cell partitioning and DNA repair
VLAFLVSLDAPNPQQVYDQLRREVGLYSETLSRTPHVVLLTKQDLLPAGAPVPPLHAPAAAGVLAISSVAGTGLDDLKEFLWRFVQTAREADQPADDWTSVEPPGSPLL